MTDGEHTRPDPLFVPVRASISQPGLISVRTGRLASGLPIGLAFTSEASLLSALGPQQQWALICEQALLDMLAPLGIDHIRIDPMLAGGTARSAPEGTGSPTARSGAQRSLSPRCSRYPASRHRHGKHRCSEHSLHKAVPRLDVDGVCSSPPAGLRPALSASARASALRCTFRARCRVSTWPS
jgi:hypothetical protein